MISPNPRTNAKLNTVVRVGGCAALLAALIKVVSGQVLVAPTPANQVTAIAASSVSYSALTRLYTYSYRFSNAATSTQEIWLIAIQFSGDEIPPILSVSSPAGWSFEPHVDRNVTSWAATGLGALPANYVDDGNVIPSPYQIKPGHSLSGFSFQSPNPPVGSTFYAQGFTLLASVANDVGELPGQGSEIQDWQSDSYIGVLVAPQGASSLVSANASVDGFFAFTGVSNGVARSSPFTLGVRFSLHGEGVDRSSFTVALNGSGISRLFSPVAGTSDLTATLSATTAPLVAGLNVLTGFVQGIDPATGLRSSKTQRVAFYVDSPPSGDVNGDGIVNCKDVRIVRSAMGTNSTQTSYDPRADVNKDGVVNIQDLLIVVRQLPAALQRTELSDVCDN